MAEVIFNTDNILKINETTISWLKDQAKSSLRKRARLCLHKDVADGLHQMVIVIYREGYVRPHKHTNKIESFHIIEGSLMLFIFDDKGGVIDKFKMSERSTGDHFLCRIEKDYWHTLVPVTDLVVVHEITNGPFTNTGDSVFADWAPEEGNTERINNFLEGLLNN